MMTKSEKQVLLTKWIMDMDEYYLDTLIEEYIDSSPKDYPVENKETLPGKGKPEPNDTVKEWLEWAVEEGYNWAPSAIAQVTGEFLTWPAKNLFSAVQYFEVWEYTKEGLDYWQSIYYDLRNKGI